MLEIVFLALILYKKSLSLIKVVYALLDWAVLLCLKRTLETASASTSTILLKYQFLTKSTEELNPRQKKMISMLFEGFKGHLTSSKWAKINKVTQMTANRDITALIERNMLVKHGSGPKTHYTLPNEDVK